MREERGVRLRTLDDTAASAVLDALRGGVLQAQQRWPRRMTPDEIEDCTQEAALKAMTSAPPRSNATAYYRRIGFSVAHEEVRRQRAQRRDAARTVPLTEALDPRSGQTSVEDRLLARERLMARLAAIHRILPAWDFKIFTLAVLGALSSAEVAHRLSLSPASVDGSISRSRRRLLAQGIQLPRRR